jgi:hypothetical protein
MIVHNLGTIIHKILVNNGTGNSSRSCFLCPVHEFATQWKRLVPKDLLCSGKSGDKA